jgi:Cu/Ag efflux protein CusF
MKTLKALVVALVLGLVAPAAQATTHGDQVPARQLTTGAEGEIRRIDRDARKLTIRHGPIQNLEMPAMTMVFQVSDPALLDRVKAGDKVRFTADKVGGAYTVLQLELMQ